ncbi:uncharacterized protein V1516DRAFT_667207 [Lipomyces oligophaga]|uniref:uncharacterized protein n=1 Tax=Lipomyces oligophaga TaxID=45792 RepID=UPI0034CDA920
MSDLNSNTPSVPRRPASRPTAGGIPVVPRRPGAGASSSEIAIPTAEIGESSIYGSSSPMDIPRKVHDVDSPSVNLDTPRTEYEYDQQQAEIEMDRSRTLAETVKDKEEPSTVTYGDGDDSKLASAEYLGEEHIQSVINRHQKEVLESGTSEFVVSESFSDAELSESASASSTADSLAESLVGSSVKLEHPQPIIPRRPNMIHSSSSNQRVPPRPLSSTADRVSPPSPAILPTIPQRPSSRPTKHIDVDSDHSQLPRIPSRPTSARSVSVKSETSVEQEPVHPHVPTHRPSRHSPAISLNSDNPLPSSTSSGEPTVPLRPVNHPSRNYSNEHVHVSEEAIVISSSDSSENVSQIPTFHEIKPVSELDHEVQDNEELKQESASESEQVSAPVAESDSVQITNEADQMVNRPELKHSGTTDSDILDHIIDTYGDAENEDASDKDRQVISSVSEEAPDEGRSKLPTDVIELDMKSPEEPIDPSISSPIIPTRPSLTAMHEGASDSVEDQNKVPLESTELTASIVPRPSVPTRPSVPKRPAKPTNVAETLAKPRAQFHGGVASPFAVAQAVAAAESAPLSGGSKTKPKPPPPVRPNKLTGARAAFFKDLESRLGKPGPAGAVPLIMGFGMPRPAMKSGSTGHVDETETELEARPAAVEKYLKDKSLSTTSTLADVRKGRARGPRGRKLPAVQTLPDGLSMSGIITVWEIGYPKEQMERTISRNTDFANQVDTENVVLEGSKGVSDLELFQGNEATDAVEVPDVSNIPDKIANQLETTEGHVGAEEVQIEPETKTVAKTDNSEADVEDEQGSGTLKPTESEADSAVDTEPANKNSFESGIAIDGLDTKVESTDSVQVAETYTDGEMFCEAPPELESGISSEDRDEQEDQNARDEPEDHDIQDDEDRVDKIEEEQKANP